MTTPIRSGIPTTYNGTRFRSRLEAKWAALFDLIGWPWTYEPFDTAGYIPDFLIAGTTSFFVEVGPTIDLSEYLTKTSKPNAAAVDLDRDVFMAGVSPIAPFNGIDGPLDNVTAGLLGELDKAGPRYNWDAALWARCFTCYAVGIVHASMSFHLRPCGHHQSGSHGQVIPGAWLNALWRRAGNDTQWAARRMVSMGDILRAVR